MVPWFIIRNGDNHHVPTPYCFAGEIVSWFMNQTNADRNRNNCAGDPSVLAREWSPGS